MKTKNFLLLWATVVVAINISTVSSCTSCSKAEIDEDIADEGLLLNDDIVATRDENGNVTFRNTTTGVVTIKDINLDWTQPSRNDSLAVFCSRSKRGYYNMYTGEIAVPAQYRRAWIFSDGLAAVQRNGNIGFIDHEGNVVIDFKFPFHGNPLNDFVFEDGHCVVANEEGKCGVIDKTGAWIIQPEYDMVRTFPEYAIATKAGYTMQVAYDGTILNTFVLDSIRELTFDEDERVENRNMFRAVLLDEWSEVILNAKGK